MTGSLILIVSLISQTYNPPKPSPEMVDKYFQVLQERWISEQIHPHLLKYLSDKHVSREERKLYKRLGCQHYDCRDSALRDLLNSRRGHIITFWGRYNLDPNVAAICKELMERFFTCNECEGSGRRYEGRESYQCILCGGSGQLLWYQSPYGPTIYYRNWFPQNNWDTVIREKVGDGEPQD